MGSVWLELLDELEEELLDEELELLDELEELEEELLDEELELLDELDELDEELLDELPVHLPQAVNKLSVVKMDKKMSKNFFIPCLQIFAKTAFFNRIAEYATFCIVTHADKKSKLFLHMHACAYHFFFTANGNKK
jgi:hypothetical protein